MVNRQHGDAGKPEPTDQMSDQTKNNQQMIGADAEIILPDVLNLASRADLAKISEVGKDRAQAIIEHRSIYGPFRSWTELAKVPGFDEQRVDRVRRTAVASGTARR